MLGDRGLDGQGSPLHLKEIRGYERGRESAVRYHIIVIAEALSALVLHVVRRVLESEDRRVKPETVFEALVVLRD
mgnify:CR=1 FL=1